MIRFPICLLLLSALFLTSCANEGVIVKKETEPMPVYHSIGMEGSYSFYLRDNAGAVHRQIVSPDVFARYSEGEYFNDLQGVPPRQEGINDFEALREPVRVAMHQPTFSVKRTAAAPSTRKTARVAQTSRKASPAKRVAASAPKKKSPAKQTASRSTKPKTQQAQRSSTRAKSTRIAAAKAKKTKRTVAKASSAKPWKMTAPNAQSLPTNDAAAPGEGPAVVPAVAPQPAASPAPADIVAINPDGR